MRYFNKFAILLNYVIIIKSVQILNNIPITFSNVLKKININFDTSILILKDDNSNCKNLINIED